MYTKLIYIDKNNYHGQKKYIEIHWQYFQFGLIFHEV